MATVFNELANRFRVFERAQKSAVRQIVVQQKDFILDLNRNQLQRGKLSTGATITPKYTPRYAAKKGFSTPNLYKTGRFYKSLNVKFRSQDLVIGSADNNKGKVSFLERQYGKDIYGLTPANATLLKVQLEQKIKLAIVRSFKVR